MGDSRFELLKLSDSRYSFYAQLSCGYHKVLIPSRKRSESPSLETVFGSFWNFVEMLEEKRVDMGMVDLKACEYFVNTEDEKLVLPPRCLLMMMYLLVPPFAHLQVRIPRDHFPPPPQLEETKGDKFSSRLDSELRRKFIDGFVSDAAYGRFVRTTLPFYDPRPIVYPYNLTRYLPKGITRRELDTIKSTAQFMTVFGIFFQRVLIERVIKDTHFDFITNHLITASTLYTIGSVLEFTKNAGASHETVLVGFSIFLLYWKSTRMKERTRFVCKRKERITLCDSWIICDNLGN